jgi:hypothetical protein
MRGVWQLPHFATSVTMYLPRAEVALPLLLVAVAACFFSCALVKLGPPATKARNAAIDSPAIRRLKARVTLQPSNKI